jgi:hypothetical protein
MMIQSVGVNPLSQGLERSHGRSRTSKLELGSPPPSHCPPAAPGLDDGRPDGFRIVRDRWQSRAASAAPAPASSIPIAVSQLDRNAASRSPYLGPADPCGGANTARRQGWPARTYHERRFLIELPRLANPKLALASGAPMTFPPWIRGCGQAAVLLSRPARDFPPAAPFLLFLDRPSRSCVLPLVCSTPVAGT